MGSLDRRKGGKREFSLSAYFWAGTLVFSCTWTWIYTPSSPGALACSLQMARLPHLTNSAGTSLSSNSARLPCASGNPTFQLWALASGEWDPCLWRDKNYVGGGESKEWRTLDFTRGVYFCFHFFFTKDGALPVLPAEIYTDSCFLSQGVVKREENYCPPHPRGATFYSPNTGLDSVRLVIQGHLITQGHFLPNLPRVFIWFEYFYSSKRNMKSVFCFWNLE